MILNNIQVFSAMARNYHSAAMNRSMIGYTLKNEFGPFTQREFDQYAAATNDDLSKYSSPDAPAPPFFFSKELYPMFKKIITHKELNLDLLRMVHAYQGLNCFGHISKGDYINVHMSIDDITETAAGEILRIATRGYREGDILFEGDTGFIVRRRRHNNGKRNGIRIVDKHEIDDAEKEIEIPVPTRKGQEKEYSKISNDTNPIHTSRFFAKIAGLPGTIMHGVCVMAICTNTFIDSFAGKDNRKLRSVSGRFTYPVYPGDTLTIIGSRGRRGKLHEINFNLYSSKGKAVIKKGHFVYSE
ncbi:MAG TPA: MaoC/PaaZ C-terminal domain-containing protein [Spirochaetota bacterium]|nr:MaoC/PaaZ C-terminal domain-containing protein [Spirochaetota bacterium]HPF05114.1 MaoC/PaaZ C-terminal domain-containing protein [Spirochaetota bacterium]HPJ42900.1 MaoC/PaaZ C-terminal domain-containing protein [Spirochaetota bacterium]